MANKTEYKRDSLVWAYSVPEQTLSVSKRSNAEKTLRVWDIGKLPEMIRIQLALEGAKNVIRDAGAGEDSDENRLSAGDSRFRGFVEGEWFARRGVSPEQKYENLRRDVAAAFDALGRDESFEDYVAGKLGAAGITEEIVVRQMAQNPKIAAKIAEMRASKLQTSVDFSDL